MNVKALAAALVLAVLGTACGAAGAAPGGPISVVAAENFWGSIAQQLGGPKVAVQSVVTDPNADPHSYESSADDARAFADAAVVILNGAGYDDWGQKLLDANPASARVVLNAAAVLGKRVGDNPHFWYDPGFVVTIADRITATYKMVDPGDSSFFDQRRADFSTALAPYRAEIASIRQRYGGTPIGSTESVFAYMAAALGLNLTTPAGFMNAVAEGNDPPAATVVELQDQISSNQIRLLVYNLQTVTAVTTNVKELAAVRHIPSVGVSETLQPQSQSFQSWQLAQLNEVEAALSAVR